MTIRTITFDDEQWQVVPQELTGSMIDTINGHIDADSDAVALWRDALIDAPEPPAQPRRPYGTDTMSEYGVIPECDGPEPPAQQPTGEHTDMLRELLASYGNSGFSAERAALTAAIEALEPPAQQPTEIEEAISAGDGTLHGAIDHWQSRALAAEAKLAAQQPMTDGQRERLLDCLGTPLNAAQWEQDIIDAVEAFHGIGKGESNAG